MSSRSATSLVGAEDWPLIGRDRELGQLTSARDGVGCCAAIVTGEAGVGKSRLAREALTVAASEGAHVEWVHATRSAATVPLGVLAGLIPEADRSDDMISLMRRCAESFGERAGSRPAVLGVDDAQLLDPASAAVVLHLARAGAAFVVATIRAGETCPDAIVSLWKDEGGVRVELDPLGDERVQALLETVLGDPVEHQAAQWVIDISRGNVLYVRELLRGALDSGALQHREGLWSLQSSPTASASLVELVQSRMANLEPPERETIELLALGEPLSPTEIYRLVDEKAVLAAEARGLLIATGENVGLAHPLYGEVVRASLPTLRGRSLRLRLVEVLEARRPFGPDEALRVARLRLDAGAALTGALTLEAARAANRAGDPELGEQLAELAMADGGSLQAAMVLASAQRLNGRPRDAATTLATVEELAAADPMRGRYLRERLGVLFWDLRRTADAADLLKRASHWSLDAAWQATVSRLQAAYTGMGEGVGSSQVAQHMAANEQLTGELRHLGATMHQLGQVLAGDGDAAAESAFADPPPSPPRGEAEIAALATLGFVAIETGQHLAELDAYLAQVVRDAVRLRVRESAGVAAFGIARLHLLRGRYRDAARWLAEAEVQLQRSDPFNQLVGVRAVSVAVACFTADHDATALAYQRLQARVAERPPLAGQRGLVACADGWAERMRDPAAAGRHLLGDAQELIDVSPGLAPAVAYEALRAGNPHAAALLHELAERCHSRIVASYSRHAAALAARDGAGLLSAAEEMTQIGALRYALEAASDAAAAFVAEGRMDSARRAAARARELHPRDQGAPLPVIDGLDTTALELTRREAQLVELARQGLPNAEIAARLVVSVRTVETHLYRAMHKLGVRDRRHL